jgi:hypothetical protein
MEGVRIREVLVPALKEHFPARPFGMGELPNCIARFAAVEFPGFSGDVGDSIPVIPEGQADVHAIQHWASPIDL